MMSIILFYATRVRELCIQQQEQPQPIQAKGCWLNINQHMKLTLKTSNNHIRYEYCEKEINITLNLKEVHKISQQWRKMG